ncbi:beta-glucosidase [Paenibacillus sp. MBLB4367]|uniref:beta-glucosidase n=1 Tax=Paenibacillus sp. MBLB4367 TaxID=3384767 RepID=UPI003907EF68
MIGTKRDIRQLIAQMTLEEKAGLCGGADFWHMKGIERLGIPSIRLSDGPHGLRVQKNAADHLGIYDSVPSTCFPTAAGVASSWNRELIGRMGVALGVECQAEEVGILLGPGTNIKRSPLCGRNFEYFSEDPYLSSEMAAHHINGVQSQGVGTSLKHFAANNQEHRRMTVDTIVDERTLREIYLASFEGAVKLSQPWTVMCAYNKVNGEYASENSLLLTDILKDEWGHEGFVVSDWGAVNERDKGLAAGLELEMPFDRGTDKILNAVKTGKLAEETLDRAVERLLTVIFKTADQKKTAAAYDKEAHHRLAREVARESMVLLKNEGGILPLKKGSKIAVIGEMAKSPRYQGGGSSRVNPTILDDIASEMAKSAGSGAEILYAQGYKLASDDMDAVLAEEAKAVAKQAAAAVLFIGLPDRYESEGYDRTHLRIPHNQVSLIESVSEVQPNVIVVLSNGSPVEMPWLGKAKAVLEAYLGGQALGGAAADLLFGDANPSGKLAETFPISLKHNPSHPNFPGEGDRVEYKEGLLVGYRYYDTKDIEPLFPFGYGLSYTNFDYSDLTLSKKEMLDKETLSVSLKVTNTGDRAGQEIIQLYVRDTASTVIRPDKELKGFDKVLLQPGEEKTVRFVLDKRSFAYYNAEIKDWHVETGQFEILIGKSSRDVVLQETVHVVSTTTLKQHFTRNSTIGDLLKDPFAKSYLAQMLKRNPLDGSMGEENAEMSMAMLMNAPARLLLWFSKGEIDERILDEMLAEINSRP